MSVVDDIKAKLDIVDYIQRYVPLKKAGRTFKANCPFHTEKTPSCVVDPDRQFWRCYGACSEGGDLYSFAQKYHGWSFKEALTELGKLAGVEVRERSPEQKARDEHLDRLRGLLEEAVRVYHEHLLSDDPAAIEVMRYVEEKRGLTRETVEAFGIGYAPDGWQNMREHLQRLGYSDDDMLEAGMVGKSDKSDRPYDRFRNRLMIPIRDVRGRMVGFGARALAPDDEPKYLNSPDTPLFDKRGTLYGLDMAKRAIRDTETVVIVEGYMDVIQAFQAGYANLVAPMGTSLTEKQLQLVAPQWAKKIIFALDADNAGQRATRRSLEVARSTLQADYTGRLSVDIRILQIPGAKDPDDLLRESPEMWAELVKNALPVADYVIDMEVAALPENSSLQEREAIARKLLPILMATENNLQQQANVQRLARRLLIAEQDLLVLANELQRIAEAKPPRQTEPPPPPPMEDEDYIPPDAEDYDIAPPDAPRVVPTKPRSALESSLELYCLRILYRDPMLIYDVNRKLRQLANGDDALSTGPLADLTESDFSRSDYREFMRLLRRATEQHEMEPQVFVRQNLDDDLAASLDAVTKEEIDEKHAQVKHRHLADVSDLWRKHERRILGGVNVQSELVQKVLQLRLQRLQREREEIHLLLVDAEAGKDDPTVVTGYQRRAILSTLAKRSIEAELRNLGRSRH